MWNNPYLSPWMPQYPPAQTTPLPNPQLQPQTILTVNGRDNAKNIKLSPNGAALVLDANEPVLYHCSADSLGNVSVVEYTITKRQEVKTPDRLETIEQKLDELMKRFEHE